MINKLICSILGIHYEALMASLPATKKAYLNSGYALFFVSILAFASGAELTINFTDSIPAIIIGGCFGSFITFCIDYFLLSNSNANFIAASSRLIFGMAMVLFSSINIQLLINHSDINKKLVNSKNTAIDSLDNDYNSAKEIRYTNYNKLVAANQQYFDSIVQKEALVGYAGKNYSKKRVKYDNDAIVIANEKAKLDSTEQFYETIYDEKRAELQKGLASGYYSKIEVLFEMTLKNNARLFMTILVMLILLGLEMTALIAKFSIDKDNDYVKIWLPIFTNNSKILFEKNIYNSFRENINQLEQAHTENETHFEAQQRIAQLNAMFIKENQFVLASLKSILREQILKKHGIPTSDALGNSANKINEIFKDASKYDIFNMTQPMKSIADSIILENQSENERIDAIFNWILTNISYDTEHTKSHYRNAKETFNNRRGVCGEMAVLYIAILKYVGIKAQYTEVNIDVNGEQVNHACVTIFPADSEQFMSDIAYKAKEVKHQNYKIITDNQLQTIFKNLNQ